MSVSNLPSVPLPTCQYFLLTFLYLFTYHVSHEPISEIVFPFGQDRQTVVPLTRDQDRAATEYM